MSSNKILGILLLLLYVCVCTAILNDAFIKPYNLQNLLRSSCMFAIIGIGAVMVIVTGGIDLSTGSLIGLVGCTMTMTLRACQDSLPAENGAWLFGLVGKELLLILGVWLIVEAVMHRNPFSNHRFRKTLLLCVGVAMLVFAGVIGRLEFGPWMTMAVAVVIALILSAHLGLLHGLLITKLKLQPFVVTLCGLMCYRGLSRYLTGDQTQGLGTDFDDSLRLLAIGKPCTVTSVVLFLGVAVVLFGLWKSLISSAAKLDRKKRVRGFVILIIGLVLTVVASSRYWDGWQVEYGNAFGSIAGLELKFFQVQVSDESAARPAELMSYAIVPAILSFLLLLVYSLSAAWKSTETRVVQGWAIPLLLVAVSVGSLFAAQYWVNGQTMSFTNMESIFYTDAAVADGDQFVMGVNVIFLKMLAVFFSMAGLMGSILWMGKNWTRQTGPWGHGLWTLLGFFTILHLLSKTAIHATPVLSPFFFLLVIGSLAALFLNTTVYGRYFFALGNNEEATRFSGINTDNVTILAYVLCAVCGGIGAILFTLDSNNVEPSGHGSFYELYAIAAAVLGGCSLRGGEGSILGVIIGASIMRVLYNAPDMIGIPSQLEMFTIGFVLLIGIIVDELTRQIAAKRDRQFGQSSPE